MFTMLTTLATPVLAGIIDLSGWNVSRAENMAYMFAGAKDFESDLSGWDVARVRNMSHMFYGARKFNADLRNWNVTKVVDMAHMFDGADAFERAHAPWYDWSNHGECTAWSENKKD